MAATDTTVLANEYAALTEQCGLVDRSERGKLALTGAGAVQFLDGQITNELLDVRPGEGRYAAFLTHKGKMLGDLRTLVVATAQDAPPTPAERSAGDGHAEAQAHRASNPAELLLDTERVALQALFDVILRFKVGYEVELHKRTLESALLSLIGPASDAVVRRAFTLDEPSLLPGSENSHVLAHLEPIDAAPDRTLVRLIRTDGGIDALCGSTTIEAVRDALEAAGALAVSQAAAEIVRVEHGRPRYGIDLDESTIPQEAGLNERAVSFTKGCYVGQETVARLYYKGKPNRHLRGLRLSAPVRPGADLRLGERSVGHLGSSVLSPTFGPIGLALVRREADPGTTVAVGEHGASALVCELPFQ